MAKRTYADRPGLRCYILFPSWALCRRPKDKPQQDGGQNKETNQNQYGGILGKKIQHIPTLNHA
jgi:hypothetical protein